MKPLSSPGIDDPSICPHCWNVNPAPFRLCARCGASMETILQESGGLRRAPAVQSPVPVRPRLSMRQRVMLVVLAVLLMLTSLVPLLWVL